MHQYQCAELHEGIRHLYENSEDSYLELEGIYCKDQ